MACSNDFKEFSYENILRQKKGLLDISIKVSVRDNACLAKVYTPGVATPCLDIQKDNSRAYEHTNKGNAILILTDSSAIINPGKDLLPNYKWNVNAAIPYLEAFSAYYKTISNVDGYPITLDSNLIPDVETLFNTVSAIALSYSGVELFLMDKERMKKFEELYEKSEYKGKYSFLDTTSKKDIDAMLSSKKTEINANAICSAIWRVVLDTHGGDNLKPVLDFVVEAIKDDKLNLNKGLPFECDYANLLEAIVDFVLERRILNSSLEKYNWKKQKLSKDYILKKFEAFKLFGSKAWVEDTPEGYFSHKHNNPDNADLLHFKNKGVVEIGLKIKVGCPTILNSIITWDNIDKISNMIVRNQDEVYELTLKGNYGAIVTNGTAILGLGNIGALAGMPVMEGKSVLFKYFGGTSVCPICIQELDQQKLIDIVRRISPSFCIINLEDIKGPDCFNIETKLIETVECPMFHDDQHGTAVVVLAGLLNAIRLRGNKPEDIKIVMNGAGAAGISVCRLLMKGGFKNFIVCDTTGAIYKDRPKNMNPFKEIIANLTNPNCEKGKLADVIKGADAFVGLSGPKMVTKEMVKSMKPKPIIFALANPTPEIYPNEAKEAGAFIVATGRSDFPNQINNSVAFPGIFRGTIDCRAPKITLDMKLAASKAIAGLVSDKELRTDFIMPNGLDINNAVKVAVNVAKTAIELGQTSKKNVNLDKLEESIASYFIQDTLTGVEN